MRYYKVIISDPVSGKVLRTFTSFVNGRTDPGALDIELDVPVTAANTPQANSSVTIWGITRSDIAQSANWNPVNATTAVGKRIQVFGGMQKGLPLAMPGQAGLLASGTIQYAFGNWIGTDMTLNLVFTAGPSATGEANPGRSHPKPVSGISLAWAAGETMGDAISWSLRDAYGISNVIISLKNNLVLPNTEAGTYETLSQFNAAVNAIAKHINPDPNYSGVLIFWKGDGLVVTDNTSPFPAKKILYTDLVGQITWLGIATVSVTCIMRGDLTVGQLLTLPQGQTTVSAASVYRNTLTFTGKWVNQGMRHVGRFRNPSGLSWVTIITALAQTKAS